MKKKFMSHFLMSLRRIFRVILFRMDSDLLLLRASALTFYSILSVVPVLAVVFGIAKGFGIEKILENTLMSEFKDQEEVIQYLIQFGYSLLEQTRGGLVAGIGVITLLYTVLNLFSTIEASLNHMWGLQVGRSVSRKISDYLALILVCPIFFATASSLTVFITTSVESLEEAPHIIGQFQPVMQEGLQLLPYLVSAMLFTFLYIFIPNTRVHFTSALIAGSLAGVAYQILQTSYISIQIVVSKTGAIYGSFAALPLFLFWLYLSWMIFLIGAEIVVIHQERLWDPNVLAPYRKLSQFEKDLTCLGITKACVDRFLQNQEPVKPEYLAKQLQMPTRLVTELIGELSDAKLIVKANTEDAKSFTVMVAKNPDDLRVYDVISALHGKNSLPAESEYPLLQKMSVCLAKAINSPIESQHNPLIKDIRL